MLKKQGFLILISVLLLLVAGCSSGTVSDNANYPITSIFNAIERGMSMGIQRYSDNHREFFSRPFLIKQDEEAMKEGFHERGVAHVTLLGQDRPYTIEVRVTIQKAKTKGPKSGLHDEDYEYDRHDQRLAKKLLMSILGILDKREHDKNIIDDFRPF